MTLAQLQKKALELPAPERVQLAEVIWDSLDDEPGAVPLSDLRRDVLTQRLDEFLADPGSALTWSEVKAKLEERS